jgi:alpha-L-fucosidase
MTGNAKHKRYLFLCLLVMITVSLAAQDLEDLQGEFVDLRFGMFIHFGIRTFTGGGWGEANQGRGPG